MAVILSGTTNDITINGVSVATDAEVTSAKEQYKFNVGRVGLVFHWLRTEEIKYV